MTDLDAITKRIIDENTTPGEVQPEPDYQTIIAMQIAKEAGISYGQAHVAMTREIARRIVCSTDRNFTKWMDNLKADLNTNNVQVLTMGALARRIDDLETALRAVLALGVDLSGTDYEKYQEVVTAREILARKLGG